jgi:hypothetical protein
MGNASGSVAAHPSSVLQWNSRLAKVSAMKPGWIFKDAEIITLRR